MTPIRQRMLEDMQLRGLAPKTLQAYATAVRHFLQQAQDKPWSPRQNPCRHRHQPGHGQLTWIAR